MPFMVSVQHVRHKLKLDVYCTVEFITTRSTLIILQ